MPAEINDKGMFVLLLGIINILIQYRLCKKRVVIEICKFAGREEVFGETAVLVLFGNTPDLANIRRTASRAR